MTIEQLEKANKIYKELNALKDFLVEQDKHYLSEWALDFGGMVFSLKYLVAIKDMIRNFTSDRISELEKQLEEL